jgi:hypothetical protein
MGSDATFRVDGENVPTGKVGSFTAGRAPVNEASVDGGAEKLEYIFCGLKMNVIWAFIELAEDANCWANVKTADLDRKNKDTRHGPVLEPILGSHCGDTGRIKGAWGCLKGLQDRRGEQYHHACGRRFFFPAELRET